MALGSDRAVGRFLRVDWNQVAAIPVPSTCHSLSPRNWIGLADRNIPRCSQRQPSERANTIGRRSATPRDSGRGDPGDG